MHTQIEEYNRREKKQKQRMEMALFSQHSWKINSIWTFSVFSQRYSLIISHAIFIILPILYTRVQDKSSAVHIGVPHNWTCNS